MRKLHKNVNGSERLRVEKWTSVQRDRAATPAPLSHFFHSTSGEGVAGSLSIQNYHPWWGSVALRTLLKKFVSYMTNCSSYTFNEWLIEAVFHWSVLRSFAVTCDFQRESYVISNWTPRRGKFLINGLGEDFRFLHLIILDWAVN